jgi:hypothetical protein
MRFQLAKVRLTTNPQEIAVFVFDSRPNLPVDTLSDTPDASVPMSRSAPPRIRWEDKKDGAIHVAHERSPSPPQ